MIVTDSGILLRGDAYSGGIANITVAENVCEKAKNMLIALGMLLPDGVTTDGDYVEFKNSDEYIFPYAGGIFNEGTWAGMFHLDFYSYRESNGNSGLRSAFCEL